MREMRRLLVLLVVVAAVLPAGSPVPAQTPSPDDVLGRPCTPVNDLDEVRPEGCVRHTFRYGPLHITPGDNLILLGPVTLEKPAEDGYVVRFRPDLVTTEGEVPRIEELHLHHAVWISTAFSHPMFATGEEKTVISVPNGYGIPVKTTDGWLLNYMVHNQTSAPWNVFITYEVDFIPSSDPAAAGIRSVEPYWLNVASFNSFNPVYNTQRGYGSGSVDTTVAGETQTLRTCAFPREECAGFDPYGVRRGGQGAPGNGVGAVSRPPAGTVVWMGGHLHPGGVRNEVDVRRGSQVVRVFNSDARYFDPGGPLSWDVALEVTRPSYRLRIEPGDEFVLNTVYETTLASWYEGMGIVVAFIARGDTSGPDPFDGSVDPDDAATTHGHLAEADNHGGGDREPLADDLPLIATSVVSIAGFAYLPGNLGIHDRGVPAVPRGEPLLFVNLDAQAAIFHTVTACRAPCNGPTGISYPLANGRVDFDSLELGFGPPGATAAANRIDYELDTSSMDPGLYTYFCRVHPFMRGVFAVT